MKKEVSMVKRSFSGVNMSMERLDASGAKTG